MRKLIIAGLLPALLSFTLAAGARDLGTWGNMFPILEPDLLDFIQHRLTTMLNPLFQRQLHELFRRRGHVLESLTE